MDRKRITEIDALRGIAAVIVVIYHYTFHYNERFGHVKPDYNTTLFDFGHYGVQLFFIISGFVIFMSVSRGKSAGDFMIKRTFRLYPAYIVAVALTFLVLGKSEIDINRTFIEAIINFTMFQEFFGVRNIDGVYWSLRVEMTFYLMMAVVLYIGAKSHVVLVSITMLISGLLVQVMNGWVGGEFWRTIERFSTANYVQLFVIGIMFYCIWQHGPKIKYMTLLIVSIIYDFLFEGISNGMFTILFVAIFGLVLAEKMKWLNNKILLFLGSISYPLYLVHQNIGYAMIKEMEKFGMTHELWILIPLGLSIALSVLIVKYIEVPVQNFLYKKYKAYRSTNSRTVVTAQLGQTK
ncbi:acyltransferase family protein [Phocicoccus pinnipedialis]|uniref:Acyltransferase family protein n=1 Tax=Phocicoccus pinnipedialis TaxID=110845 RepID=A0A6V7R774_9BACL|nr:acyltransferase [Jeotgalicoccus pinnipedialis]MBP1938860.1 peptidoglycan/LPS O-acetylase OafA/YrhL [Jeotgalicoccus pinnipedialis]CAD2073300.1 Acyltransferase family protein [Jeotgalicoccus pinnipedialis]